MAHLGTPDEAVETLRQGGLACFPTETLWSLSAPALDLDAVAQVFAAKGRDEDTPLAVGFAAWHDAWPYVRLTPGANALAEAFLPGPLSLVLERIGDDLAHVAPGRETLSVRVPDHPVAADLLEACGPLVMTSANRHGEADPVSSEDVVAAMEHVDDLVVVDAEPVPGRPSTVVDATGERPGTLREGVITEAEVAAAWP